MKYKYFILRSINVMLIILFLAGYQFTLYLREKEQTIVDLQTQMNQIKGEYTSLADSLSDSNTTDEETNVDTVIYKDGTYEGSAEGFGGEITVQVLIKNEKIDSVKVLSAKGEDSSYLTMAEDIIPEIVANQSAGVDTVSGATYSSTGIKNAVSQALSEAEEE